MATATLPIARPRSAVAAKLRHMAGVQARLDVLSAELEQKLDVARRRYAGRIGTLQQRLRELTCELEAICRAQRDAVFADGRKSYRTPHGEVAFRKAEPAVRVRDGLTDSEVCRLLRRSRLARLVRTKQSPDRAAIRKALAEADVTADRLERCGLELTEQAEHFRCRISRPGLPAGRAVGGRAR